jgi:uncharacterized OB-fold protein
MRVVPELGPLGADYWKALREHQLVVQSCESCAHAQHPPLPICAACGGANLSWREVEPEGTLYAFAVVHHATHVAFAGEVPYAVGLVEVLPEVRIVARIRGDESSLRIGMPLVGAFHEINEDLTLLDFSAI